jgi:hypothetical protein
MSKSPLSGAFADSSATTKKKSKKNGAILLIAGIALTSSIGGVFAATNSIDINAGADLEFGQGTADVDTCAADATTTMGQVYDSSDDEFYVTDVVVTFAPVSPATCNGKEATISLVTPTGLETLTVTIASEAATVDFTSDEVAAGDVTNIAVSTAD